MKKICLALALLAVILPFNKLGAQQKTDAELLEETVKLSKEVKEFGKTIGIEPTQTFGKSSAERAAPSLLILYLQKRKSLAISVPIDIKIFVQFPLEKSSIPITQIFQSSEEYDIFVRHVNEFQGGASKALITTDFSKMPHIRKVMVILHEDFHGRKSRKQQSENEEALTTPIGFLAALKFFETKSDTKNAEKTLLQINHYRVVSRELNILVKEMVELLNSAPPESITEMALSLIRSFPAYEGVYWNYMAQYNRVPQFDIPLEAKISHDWAYWKYFDRVVALYEKSGGLKTLIEDIEKAPWDTLDLEKYLDELDQKYGSAKK